MSLSILALLFASIAVLQQVSSRSPSDREEIAACIGHYFRAGDTNDSAELRRAFHPTTVMFSVTAGGALAGVSQPEWWARLDAAGAPRKARERQILWIDVDGDAATARLRSEYDTFAFEDYVTLLRVGGRWQIVGKIFHRSEPPTAAAAAAVERDSVEAVVRTKFSAMDASDPDLLGRAYHPRAMTYSVGGGQLVAVSIEEWRARFAQSRASGKPAQAAERSILNVDVAHTAAVAKFSHKVGNEEWIDYASLLKVDGQWRIVGLVYVRRP
jgi:protease I